MKNIKGRLSIIFKVINRSTLPDAYPLPDLEQIVAKVSKNTYFSIILFQSAYHQIPPREGARPFTTFEVYDELYQFKHRAGGVIDGISTFQRVIKYVIAN